MSGRTRAALTSALRHSDRIRNLEKRGSGRGGGAASSTGDEPEKDCVRLNLDVWDLDKINVRRLSHALLKEFCGKYRKMVAPGPDRMVDLRAGRSELLKWAEDAQVKRSGKAPGREDPSAPASPAAARRRAARRSAASPATPVTRRATPFATPTPRPGATAMRPAPKPPAYNPTAPTYRPTVVPGGYAAPSTFAYPQKPIAVAPAVAPHQQQQLAAPEKPTPAQWPDVSMRGTSGLLAHSHSNNVNNNHNFNNNNNSNNSGWVGGDVNPHSAAPYNDERPKPTGPPPSLPPLPGGPQGPRRPPQGPPAQGPPPQGPPRQGLPPQGPPRQ